MSAWFHNTGVQLTYWRLAIWKGVNGTIIVALGGIVAGLANLQWADMDTQARFLFCAGVALSVLKSVDMLLDQTIGNLRNHQPPADAPPAQPAPPGN